MPKQTKVYTFKDITPTPDDFDWQAKAGNQLVEPDPLELTDHRLSPQEMVAKQREELLKKREKDKCHGQDELEKAERSCGPRIYWKDLIKRLKKINPGIHAKEGSPGSMALYYRKKSFEYRESDFYEIPPNGEFYIHHKYVGGIRKEWIPEWDHVELDTDGIALRPTGAWRSNLIALIKQGVISYSQAIEEFGDPTNDPRAKFWFEELFNKRQAW